MCPSRPDRARSAASRRGLVSTALLAILLVSPACDPGGPASPTTTAPETPPRGLIELSARAFDFAGEDDERTLRIVNHGEAKVAWRVIAVSGSWLEVEPTAGTSLPGETPVTLRVDRDALSEGDHRGEARLRVGDGEWTVEVRVHQSPRPRARLGTNDLSFGPDDQTLPLELENVGGRSLAWQLEGPGWLARTPESGTLPTGGTVRIEIAPDRANLPDGIQRATLRLESDGGRDSVAVIVEVASPARLAVEPGTIDFGEHDDLIGIDLINRGGRPLDWSGRVGDGWARLSESSGELPARATRRVTLTVNRTVLAAGRHETVARFVSDAGEIVVPVRLTIRGNVPPDPAPPDSSPPGPPPSPPPNPPPSGGSVALAGLVVDQFSRAGLPGITVTFGGMTAVTDADGRFTIHGTPSDALAPVTFSGRIHTRNTFARATDDRWLVLSDGFNMRGFDDMAREYEPRTIRWVDPPRVYLDVTPPDGYPAGSELDAWIAEVRNAIEGFVTGWSHGRLATASVTMGTDPPPEGTAGWMVIGFDENPARYSGSRTVGLARTFWTSARTIHFARIWLRFSLLEGPDDAGWRRAVVGHELGHAMGLGHMEGGTASLMTPSVSSTDFTPFDRSVGNVLYTRSPGNSTPDTDSASTYRGALTAAGRTPAGANQWICEAPGAR